MINIAWVLSHSTRIQQMLIYSFCVPKQTLPAVIQCDKLYINYEEMFAKSIV